MRDFRPLQVDFSAKVQWRMRFDRSRHLITLQDKLALRDYAADRGVKTARLLYVTDRPETIPFEQLPPACMIKACHGSGWNILRLGGQLFRFGHGQDLVAPDGVRLCVQAGAPSLLSREEAVRLCNAWLAHTYSRREWAYQQIPPRIIVEELLTPRNQLCLHDYRLYTFHGAVKAINVGSPGYRKALENVFFDPDWKEFRLTSYREQRPDPLPERPDSLAEMIAVAGKIGLGVDFVRVDLYDTSDGLVLGEATVYPEAGKPGTPTSCPLFNQWLGDQWALSKAGTCCASMWTLACRVRWQRRRIIRGLLGRRRA